MNLSQQFRAYAIYRKLEALTREGGTLNSKITQCITLGLSLLGTIGIPSVAASWLQQPGHLTLYVVLVAVAIVLHAIFPSIFAAPSAAAKKDAGLDKLGALALISLVLIAGLPIAGCNGTTVAQDIVNWTPTIVSTANTVSSVVASLDPSLVDKAAIAAATTGFDAAAQLLSTQAQTYLKNPTASMLQQLQAQVLSFQQNVNTALLQAAKITNSASQQRVILAIQALATGITAVLGLISSIKGTTVTPAAAVKLSQVLPLMDRDRAIAEVAQHYGEPVFMASLQYDRTIAQLQAAGL